MFVTHTNYESICIEITLELIISFLVVWLDTN